MKVYVPILVFALLLQSCNNAKIEQKDAELGALKIELDSLKANNSELKSNKTGKISSFLTFQKEDAEQAMNLYVELFENSEILDIKRWGENGPGKEGTIMQATFSLNGQQYMCSDSPPIHEWDFSPAISNFVECKDKEELNRLYEALSVNGEVFMPPGNYGFSTLFTWVVDRFGISWQLNLQ